MSDPYIFPFTTCERKNPDGFVAQPYSFVVNFMTAMVLLFILGRAKAAPPAAMLVVGLLAVFELWHAFSHFKHISGQMQRTVIHTLVYFISAAFLYFIVSSGIYEDAQDRWVFFWIAAVVALDAAALTFGSEAHWSVITGVLVFACILFWFRRIFDAVTLAAFSVLIVIGIVMFLLEKKYCTAALKWRVLPYHAIVEIVVSSFIALFAYSLAFR